MTQGTALIAKGADDIQATKGAAKLEAFRLKVEEMGGFHPPMVFNPLEVASTYPNSTLKQVVGVMKAGSATRVKLSVLALRIENQFGKDVIDQMINYKWMLL